MSKQEEDLWLVRIIENEYTDIEGVFHPEVSSWFSGSGDWWDRERNRNRPPRIMHGRAAKAKCTEISKGTARNKERQDKMGHAAWGPSRGISPFITAVRIPLKIDVDAQLENATVTATPNP